MPLSRFGYGLRSHREVAANRRQKFIRTQVPQVRKRQFDDWFNTADRYDVAGLLSGDGDFERAVELLRSKGKGILGMGTQGLVSPELEHACQRYIRPETIRSVVEKIR
ncbi:MAG: NYN domain-containing protein [Firmicutes bacterium]|nr:NYN domain-containing protein [Bacillota bacterium]